MHSTARFLISLAAGLVASGAAAADDWPHWRGPDRDGISKESGWDAAAVGAGRIAWEAQVGAGYSAVSVAGGKVYTAGNFRKDTDAIQCLDEATGKELWRHEYPEELAPKYYSGGCSATPTVAGGKVYFASKSGKLFCLDAGSGKVVWSKEFGFKAPTWGFASSALVLGKAAIFNAGSGGVAYDKDTGAELWRSADGECGYATPVPFKREGKTLLAIFAKDTLALVDAADGKARGAFPWRTQHDVNAADPIVSGDQVFITSGYGHGCALVDISGGSPRKLWENKNMRSHMSGPVLIDGHLYGFDDNKLACLDWKTGDTKWEERWPRKGALSAAGDKLIVLGEEGRLATAEADPGAYREIAGAQVLEGRCWTMPVLANGRIYARNSDGHLVAVEARK